MTSPTLLRRIVYLEVCWNGCTGGVGEVDHVLPVQRGGLSGLLSVPDGLHLGVVGAELSTGFIYKK